MMSTDVNRTIQSGYSELMGLYPPGQSGAERMTSGMVESIKDPRLTPFKVRDADKINDQLGFAALPEDFTAMPILLYMNDDINDDASDDGCPYIYQVSGARASTASLWTKYDSWKDQIKQPIHESIGATE